MASIVDAFYVAFGFDTSGLTKGEEEVERSSKKTRERLKKDATETEKQAKELSATIGNLRKQVVGLMAVFTAGMGVKVFANHLASLDVGLGRVAYLTGQAVKEVSQWRNAIRAMGGDGDAVVSGMHSLTQEMQQFAATGESAVVPYLRALGVSIVDEAGGIKTAAQIYLDAAQSIEERGMDPARGEFFLRGLGMTDMALITAALKGRAELQKALDEQAAYAPTEEDIENQNKFIKAWEQIGITSESVGRRIMMNLFPAIEKVLEGINGFMDFLNTHEDVAVGFFSALTAAVVAFGISAVAAMGATAIATTLATGGIILVIGALAAAVSYLIRNWDKVKQYFAGWVEWIRIKYNAAAKFFGLPTWDTPQVDYEGPRGGGSAFDQDRGRAPGSIPPSGRPQGSEGGLYKGAESDIQHLMRKGWTREQATGIAANIHAESGGNIGAVGDNKRAYGLAQWHPDRQAAFRRWKGKDIRSATREEQLDFIDYEMRQGNEKNAGAKLQKTKSAGEAASVVSQYYERPLDRYGEAEKRERLASNYRNVPKTNVARGAPGSTSVFNSSRTENSRAVTQSQTTNVGTVNVNAPQAKDAEGIAREIKPALERTRLTQQGNYGAW